MNKESESVMRGLNMLLQLAAGNAYNLKMSVFKERKELL